MYHTSQANQPVYTKETGWSMNLKRENHSQATSKAFTSTSSSTSMMCCALCSFEFPNYRHLLRCQSCDATKSLRHLLQICSKCSEDLQHSDTDCPSCKVPLELIPPSVGTATTNKQRQTNLQQCRLVIPNLLYVIGLPKKYSNETLLRSQMFFG